MTPEEEISAKFRCRTNIPSVIYNGKKVEYFVEDNKERYDLYFLVTDHHFDPNCDKDALHREFAKMKRYLYDEGFLDSCTNGTDPDKEWKIHFLLQYQPTPSHKLDLSDNHRKPQSMLWALAKTIIIVVLIYALLKWVIPI